MCAGTQNLAFYHDDKVFAVEGCKGGDYTINFLKGTLTPFMSMSEAQRKIALSIRQFPEIFFKSSTAHRWICRHDLCSWHGYRTRCNIKEWRCYVICPQKELKLCHLILFRNTLPYNC